jgi:hypothetical protein
MGFESHPIHPMRQTVFQKCPMGWDGMGLSHPIRSPGLYSCTIVTCDSKRKWNRTPNWNRTFSIFDTRNRKRNRKIKENGTGTGRTEF